MGGSSSKPDNTSEAENQPSTQLKEIPTNLLTLTDNLIAEGSFAEVFDGFLRRGTDTNNEEDRYDEQCAVKVFKKGAKVQVQKHMTEAILAFKVSSTGHPNIVTVFGIWKGHNSGQLAIVMERCLTSLYDMIQSPKSGSEKMKLSEKRSLLLEVCQGMQFLTQKKVFHGDLTTKNILLVRDRSTERLVPKIGDFGLSKVLVDSKPVRDSVHQGNEDFMPPEMLKVGKLKDALSEGAEQIDLFSFGCCALHVGTGVYPAPGPLIQQGRLSTSQETASPFQRREGPLVKLSSSEAQLFRPIVRKCLMFKPSERGTFADVLSILEAHKKGYADVDTRHLYEDAVTEREDLKTELSTANKEKESMQRQLKNKEESITKMKNLHEQATEDQGNKISEKEAVNKSLSEELVQCQSKCADADSLAERLKQQVTKLEGELEKEQTNKKSLQKRVEEMESSNAKAIGFTTDFRTLLEEKITLQAEKRDLNDNLLTKTRECEQQHSKLQALSLELNETQESLQAANSQKNELEVSLRESDKTCQATKQSLLQTKNDWESSKQTIQQWETWHVTTHVKVAEELEKLKENNLLLEKEKQKAKRDLSNADMARQELKNSLSATMISKQQLTEDMKSLETGKSSLAGENSRLGKEVEYLKGQLEKYETLAKSVKEKHSALDVEYKVVVSQHDEAKASLKNIKKEKADMHKQIGELQKTIGHLESTVGDRDGQISDIRGEIVTRKAEVGSFQSSLQDAKSQIDSLRQAKGQAERGKATLKRDLDSSVQTANKLKTDKNMLSLERDRIKNILDVRMDDLKKSESKVSELQKEITILTTAVEGEGGLHEKCKTQASENEQLQATLKEKGEDLAKVTSEKDDLSSSLEKKKLELGEAHETIEQLKGDEENKDEEIRRLTHQKRALESELATATNEQKRLDRQIKAMETEHLSDLSSKKEENNKQQQNLKTEHEKEITKMQGQVEGYKKQLSGSEEKRDKLDAECRSLLEMKAKESSKMTELLSSKTRINCLEAEREDLKSSLAVATASIRKLKGALEAAEEKAQESEKCDQQSQELLKKYRKESVTSEANTLDLQVKISEAENQIKEKVAQLKEKDAQFTGLNELVKHLRTELEALKCERSQLGLRNDCLHATVTERNKSIEKLSSEQHNSLALSQRAEDRERDCAELKESLQNSAKTLSAQFEENQTLKQESVEKCLRNDDLKRQLDVMVEKMSEKDGAIAQFKENRDKQNLLCQNLEGRVRKLNSKCAEGDGYKLQYEGAIADNCLMQEKLSKLERNGRDATSRLRAVSSDIVSVQPQLYLFSQLTETFDSFYSRDISDVVHKKQPLPSCNDLDMCHFGDDWKARLPPLKDGCDNPDVESFLSSVAKSNPQCHCHGHFCITMLSRNGYPELHFFVVSSCELLLSDTASLQPQQRRYICEVFPIDSKWWKDAKLPRMRVSHPILFKPVGLFPNCPSNLDELPVSLKPVVSCISERLCLNLRTLITGVGCHLHRSDVGLPNHPTCSVQSREV